MKIDSFVIFTLFQELFLSSQKLYAFISTKIKLIKMVKIFYKAKKTAINAKSICLLTTSTVRNCNQIKCLPEKKMKREKQINVINLLWKWRAKEYVDVNKSKTLVNHEFVEMLNVSVRVYFCSGSFHVGCHITRGEKTPSNGQSDSFCTIICMKNVIKCITMKIAFCLVFSIRHHSVISLKMDHKFTCISM